jgi:hypothetical protein
MYPYNLEYDLVASNVILNLVKDDSFAKELYAALCNMRWVFMPPEDPETVVIALKKQQPSDYGDNDAFSASWRYAGGIIADLRNRFLIKQDIQEDYMDWYSSGGEGTVSERVAKVLAEMHWYPVEWPDSEII